MKFVDSAKITVIAGNGGNGCISFQKIRKSHFLRSPSGSNGGDGGNVQLLVDTNINTLNYFQSHRIFKAEHGLKGCSRNCTGRKGRDLIIKVPRGTRVLCQNSYRLLGDMTEYSTNKLIVARGGRHGLGNNSFKYFNSNKKGKCFLLQYKKSIGSLGEIRHLLLELILIADIGLFGLPNVGKSSFLKIVSNAQPKIASYPFTTLSPNLGVVQMDNYSNSNKFIIADIPGIIKGASSGIGLGTRFLRHLTRCRMLLHFVDINCISDFDIVNNIVTAEQELCNYNFNLAYKTRWLIFNKVDLINNRSVAENKVNHIIQLMSWKDRYYIISVKDNINIRLLCHDIMEHINYNNMINGIVK